MSSVLWYRKPASEWKEGLPAGNGVLPGVLFGGAESERNALNRELLWRGRNRERHFEPRHQRLAETRAHKRDPR